MNPRTHHVLPLPRRLAISAALLIAIASPAAQSNTLVSTLVQQQRFSTADRRALEGGQAVVKSLETPIRRELAHVAVVHINGAPERFVERFRDIERFERGPGIPQIGRFSSPPRAEDLTALTLTAKDIAALPTCRAADCDFKLSSAAMDRFRTQVNWSSPNAAMQAQDVARTLILEVVRAYQANGDAALGSYHDREEPVPIAEEFRALLASSTLLPLPVPGLMAYLAEYPRSRPAGVEEFFYWSTVDFGFRPTVRVNHVVIQPLPGRPSGVSHVMAIKQLYASHYFQSALEIRFLVDDGGPADRPGFYLISITRSRIDGTSGLKGSLLRSVINRRSRTAVGRYLEHLKRQVERPMPS